MKIGVFGGSFDPVHLGHTLLIKQAALQVGLGKVIIVPTRLQPFKLGGPNVGGDHRIRMLELALEEISGDFSHEISRLELDKEGVSYTVDTLRDLSKIYPDDDIYFVVGTDSFLSVPKWKKHQELLSEYKFIVGARPGYRESDLLKCIEDCTAKYGTEVEVIENEQVDVSSTEIRNMISEGLPLPDVLPESVERYITENGLYR